MKKQRPKNLNLFTFHYPIPAIVSILHRLSGFLLFLIVPLMLWGLNLSLSSQQSFDSIQQVLSAPLAKFLIWCALSAFLYHFVAGIRHLLMDVCVGVELKSGKLTSILTLIISFLLILLAGVWVW